MFKVKKIESLNKTVRLPSNLIEQLERIANVNDISFNQMVIQCCEYALSHLCEEETPK